MIQDDIRQLTAYGIKTGLILKEDEIYIINRLLEFFRLDELSESTEDMPEEPDLEMILQRMLDYAYEKGILT